MEPEERMAFFITKLVGERARQRERWGDEHDDLHKAAELGKAAAFYAWPDEHLTTPRSGGQVAGRISLWPFDEAPRWDEERLLELAKAGALILAEAERLMRAQEVSDGPA